jgi:hypothetical protein
MMATRTFFFAAAFSSLNLPGFFVIVNAFRTLLSPGSKPGAEL